MKGILYAQHTVSEFPLHHSPRRLRTEPGIPATILFWTIRKVLNQHGPRYLQSRRKGMLTRTLRKD